ncbi:MAG: hypothetical protein ACK6DM_15905 [Alphaproteobacteria bacterium]
MTIWTNPLLRSNDDIGRGLVVVICLVGASVCGVVALGTANGGMSYLMTLVAGAFLLAALLPRSFAPRFGQFLLCAVCVITFMGVGGGVKQGVSLLDWLTILPLLLFALLLSFPRGAVLLFRRMVGACR